MVITSSTMPGSSRPVFEPSICGWKMLAVEVVELLVEDADEPDVLAARVLEVGEPGDHLAAMQAVGAANVGLAGLLGEGLGLPLHHWKQSRPATVIESTKTVSYRSSTAGSPKRSQTASKCAWL
jgi:hypothetical protein